MYRRHRFFSCMTGIINAPQVQGAEDLARHRPQRMQGERVAYRTTLHFTAVAPPRIEAGPQGSMLRRDDRNTCSPPLG